MNEGFQFYSSAYFNEYFGFLEYLDSENHCQLIDFLTGDKCAIKHTKFYKEISKIANHLITRNEEENLCLILFARHLSFQKVLYFINWRIFLFAQFRDKSI